MRTSVTDQMCKLSDDIDGLLQLQTLRPRDCMISPKDHGKDSIDERADSKRDEDRRTVTPMDARITTLVLGVRRNGERIFGASAICDGMELILGKAQSMMTLVRNAKGHLRREVALSIEGKDLSEGDRVDSADLFMAPAKQLLDRDTACDEIKVALDPGEIESQCPSAASGSFTHTYYTAKSLPIYALG